MFAKDAGITAGHPVAVALPETSDEVAEAVRICRRHRLPLVARGAGTGLAGGAVATRPSLCLVMTRMNRIDTVDAESRSAWLGPGVINLDLSRATATYRLHYAPDPSSQQACTIGGNVGTNAGGPHCLLEGSTVAHVLAVEFVDSWGEVHVLGGEAPDSPGLDMRGVVVGSEGTLGIVTRILVRLTPDPPAIRTLLLAFESVEAAAATVSAVIAGGIVPAALEMMDREMIEAVNRFLGGGYPPHAEAVLIAEVGGVVEAVEREAAIITATGEEHGASGVRVAVPGPERDLIWKGRKSAFGAVAQSAPDYFLHDVVVPRTRLVEVLTQVYGIGKRHGLTMLNVFHAGDGNLHPLMAFDASEAGMLDKVHTAAAEIVDVALAAGGVLTGEHGIGLEKRDLMGRFFNEMDLDAQARLQEAFDPDGIMNPDKVLPAGARCVEIGRRSQ